MDHYFYNIGRKAPDQKNSRRAGESSPGRQAGFEGGTIAEGAARKDPMAHENGGPQIPRI